MDEPVAPPAPPRRPGGTAALAALAALAVVPVVVAWGAVDGDPAPTATAGGPPVALVPSEVPDDLRLEDARATTWPRTDLGYAVYGPAPGGDQAAPPSTLPPGLAGGATATATATWLPADLGLLWDGATLPPGTGIPVAGYTLAHADGAGAARVEVLVWQGVPDAALGEIREPIGATSTSVRGHPAVLDVDVEGERGGGTLRWVEAPGLVVLVDAAGAVTLDELLAFAEGLEPVDAAGWEAFAASAPAPTTGPEEAVADPTASPPP